MAARRSSRSVALCKRPLRVFIVVVAFCFAGACDSNMRNMADYAVVVGRMQGEAENRMVQHNLRPIGSGADIRAGSVPANDEIRVMFALF